MAQGFWWTNQREELYSKFIKDLEEKGGNIIGCQATTKSRISSGRMMNFRFAITSIKIRRYSTYFEKMKKKGRKREKKREEGVESSSSYGMQRSLWELISRWINGRGTFAIREREREREWERMSESERERKRERETWWSSESDFNGSGGGGGGCGSGGDGGGSVVMVVVTVLVAS